MSKKKQQAQQELPGMPEKTPAAKHAEKYLEIKDEIDKLQKDLKAAGKNLYEAMTQENKSKIHINGRTLRPKYNEARVTIQIKKDV